ncbi:MAG TPA: ABC transporter permease [Verrucomicrobiae bacterium]|nr:ABC transporter permease [Verrucomicrobiae bacterium]
MRSALTTLGIIVGIVTVTLMGTAIEGLNGAFKQSISSLGSDVLYVQRTGWFVNSYQEWMKVQHRKDITIDQVRQLEKQLTLAKAVAPVAMARRPARFKNRSTGSVFVLGTSEGFLSTSGVSVALGRFFTPGESDGGRPVVVIGSEVATNLFQKESPIGKTLKIDGYGLEVIGVLESQGRFLGQFSLDNMVFVPYRRFVGTFRNRPDYEIRIKALSVEQLPDLEEEVRGVLRKIRHVKPGLEDDFAINKQEQFLETFNKVGGTIATAGLFITGLSLFVGGIGIMNIMFVSVAERTREIGIRKAIGAKRRTILIQFLTEAAAICLLGGLIGLAIAWPMTMLINRFMPTQMSLTIVGIAILVSLLTGVISGFFPAWRAARMNPVDALRSE